MSAKLERSTFPNFFFEVGLCRASFLKFSDSSQVIDEQIFGLFIQLRGLGSATKREQKSPRSSAEKIIIC
jgi:hypothetical protein